MSGPIRFSYTANAVTFASLFSAERVPGKSKVPENYIIMRYINDGGVVLDGFDENTLHFKFPKGDVSVPIKRIAEGDLQKCFSHLSTLHNQLTGDEELLASCTVSSVGVSSIGDGLKLDLRFLLNAATTKGRVWDSVAMDISAECPPVSEVEETFTFHTEYADSFLPSTPSENMRHPPFNPNSKRQGVVRLALQKLFNRFA